jgi:LysM repeat protein
MTPRFVRCPRFVAASGSTWRGDAVPRSADSQAHEVERTLSWIGVGALGCVAGVVISALVFLLLPSPGGRTDSGLQSDVAGIVAKAARSEATIDGGFDRHYQMTEAEERAEIPRPVRQAAVDTPTPSVDAEQSEPAPQPASSEVFAGGEPAGPGEATHVIAEGETLWGIAADNGLDVSDLAARNGLPEDALVMTGDVLVIPAATVDGQP